MPLMTDFMRKVRAGTAGSRRRKGRPFTLMLRVPATREGCRRIGLDVPAWIREELADLIIPMNGGYLEMGAEIAAFTEIAAGTSCRIGGGLERFWPRGTATPATTCCTPRHRASGTRGRAASTCSTTTAIG